MICTVPGVTPVINPVLALIVATVGAALLHAPPEDAFVRVVVSPEQTASVPNTVKF